MEFDDRLILLPFESFTTCKEDADLRGVSVHSLFTDHHNIQYYVVFMLARDSKDGLV